MSWNHGYALDEYLTRKINGGDHGITGRDIFNAKVLLKCCSELLTQCRFLCRFERPVSIHSSTGFIFLGTGCMFWFRMGGREVKFDVYGKRQTFAVCLQLSVQ